MQDSEIGMTRCESDASTCESGDIMMREWGKRDQRPVCVTTGLGWSGRGGDGREQSVDHEWCTGMRNLASAKRGITWEICQARARCCSAQDMTEEQICAEQTGRGADGTWGV